LRFPATARASTALSRPILDFAYPRRYRALTRPPARRQRCVTQAVIGF